MVTTGGKVVITIGIIVMFIGLAFASNPLIIMFMFFAGIATIIQGAKMKPLPKVEPKQPETKTYTFEPRKDTKGALGNVKNKGAV